MPPKHRLITLGHATMLLLENDKPLIATDPWLVGSAYWRSWWLEKYPTDQEFDQVKRAEHIYLTHSHPDHFHYPTLRKLGKPSTLHPTFPRYDLPEFLKENGFPVEKLDPWSWYRLTDTVEIASIPVPVDDSILVVKTPKAFILNLNDSVPRLNLLRFIRKRMLDDRRKVIVMKSYSPASIAVSIYRDGKQTRMKSTEDYATVAVTMSETLGANYFVPFASQAFFNRKDSKWANDFKVRYEDLKEYWKSEKVSLCQPFTDMDLESFEIRSEYANVNRDLDEVRLTKVIEREQEEERFELPDDFVERLRTYMREIYFLRLFFGRGIGWRLTSSGKKFFYNTRTKEVETKIPVDYDVIIGLPDKVLYESLENNVLTDLGITMFIKVETKVSNRFTYGLFLLMGLHDYGHFNSFRAFARFTRFYVPYVFPKLLDLRQMLGKSKSRNDLKNLRSKLDSPKLTN